MFTVEPLEQVKLDALLAKDHTVVTLKENDSCFKVVPPFTGKCYCCWDPDAFSLIVFDGMVPKIDGKVVYDLVLLSSDIVLFEDHCHYIFYSISKRCWSSIDIEFVIKQIIKEYQLFELYEFDETGRTSGDIHYYYDYSNHNNFQTVGEYRPDKERLNVKLHEVSKHSFGDDK